MSDHAYLPRRPLFPSDLRRLFRTLSRIAVAGSFGVATAGCNRHLLIESDATGQPDGGIREPMAGQGAPSMPQQPTAGMNSVPIAGMGSPPTGGMRAPMPAQDGGVMQPPPSQEWSPVACTHGRPSLFEHARLDQPIDYAALYRTYSLGFGEPWQLDDAGVPVVDWERLFIYGIPCSGARDRNGCLSSVAVLTPDPSACLGNADCEPFILTTQGDRVTRIEERAALLALLGTIDTEADAVIATLLSAEHDPTCYYSDNGSAATGTRVRPVAGGYEVESTSSDCTVPTVRIVQRITTDGVISQVSREQLSAATCVAGRRPVGLAPSASVACSELGAYLANAAYLEAASVHSFARLAAELRALGAPDALVTGALQAALDEIAHARTVGALAVQRGGVLNTPSVTEPATRSAFEIALENTVEGCVREAYGALVACYQAVVAQDDELRAAMTQIAEDETRHAQLSMSVAAWLEPQLSSEHQALLAQARIDAFAQLARELTLELAPATRAALGMPSAEVASFLLTELGSALGFATRAA